jgi:anti-anti-sigma factor
MIGRFLRRARRRDGSGAKGGRYGGSRAGSAAERLRVEVIDGPRSARMALHGEFDIASADEAGRVLQELLGGDLDAVVIDLSELEFMDSTGVKFLVDGRETARARGVRLRLVHGGDPVRRVLTVSGVTALFEDLDDGHSSP